jgi:hypothetical protein
LLEFFGADDASDISFNVGKIVAVECVENSDNDKNITANKALIFFLSFYSFDKEFLVGYLFSIVVRIRE